MYPIVVKKLGPRYVNLIKLWVPSLATYGGTAALLGLLFTDWKVTNRFIPFYGGKFDEKRDIWGLPPKCWFPRMMFCVKYAGVSYFLSHFGIRCVFDGSVFADVIYPEIKTWRRTQISLYETHTSQSINEPTAAVAILSRTRNWIRKFRRESSYYTILKSTDITLHNAGVHFKAVVEGSGLGISSNARLGSWAFSFRPSCLAGVIGRFE